MPNKRSLVLPLAALCALLLWSSPAFGHGGGLDKQGCHADRKTGKRHCHRGPEAENRKKSYGGSRYNRKEWLPRWGDADGDCQNTRHEVLIEESLVPVTLSADGCWVVSGKWADPYSGKVFTDPKELDVDHLVPLKEAHISGGAYWSIERKRSFANDLSYPDTLIAVSRRENRAKGAKDPARWLPSNQAYHCEYVRSWKRVKNVWGLGSDSREREKIWEIKRRCR